MSEVALNRTRAGISEDIGGPVDGGKSMAGHIEASRPGVQTKSLPRGENEAAGVSSKGPAKRDLLLRDDAGCRGGVKASPKVVIGVDEVADQS